MDTTAIRQTFLRDGFALVDGFFAAPEMDELEREIEGYIRDVAPTLPPGIVLREQHTSGPIKSMSRMNEFAPFFAGFKAHPRFVALAADIFQVAPAEIITETMQFFGKAAYEGSTTPWHQDNGFQHFYPPESLIIWTAIDDVDEANGCVLFARGSHRLGTVAHKPSGVLAFSQMPAEPVDLARFPPVKSVLRRGGISLHHCNTFHSSGPNRSPRSRRAIAINFRTPRCQVDEAKRAAVKAEAARLYQEKVGQLRPSKG